MKIGKKVRSEKITNPFRPVFGIPRKHTVCRITVGSRMPHRDEHHYNLQIDHDPSEDFELRLKSEVPPEDRYKDKVLELWFTTHQHYEVVFRISKDIFDEVIIVDGGKVVKHKK